MAHVDPNVEPDAGPEPAPPTQQVYPARAGWRTYVQTFLGTVLTLGVVLPIAVQIVGEELGKVIPESWVLWLVGASGVIAAVAKGLSRIMAIPAVDRWLKNLGLSSTPEV